tara:strand:+ start:232 stop:939 length:708 start_codon:yes stop_codon:yes gene_type:complete
MKKSISIIIPILNEEKNIKKLSEEIKKKLNKIKFEVIFVDDKSIDDSLNILKKIKYEDKRFNYFIHKGKRDLTQSCFLGIRKSKNNLIVIMDGDLQHNPIYIKYLLNKIIISKCDLVIGSRNFGKLDAHSISVTRVFFSKFLIYLLKKISGKYYTDPMSGFFIFKKNIYLNNTKKFYGKGYKILADFIYNIPKLKISEITIKFRSRGGGNSKMGLNILIILVLFMIKKIIQKFTY